MPEHVREALKPGGNIRAGMIPTNRVTCLVSYPGVLQIVLGSHVGGEGGEGACGRRSRRRRRRRWSSVRHRGSIWSHILLPHSLHCLEAKSGQ